MLDILFSVIYFLFGAIIGSFLNVVILRYISKETFMKGRSKCMTCQKTLRWWELIPIFSFIFLRGKCQRCQASISVQYPIVELAMGVVTVMVVSMTWIPACLSGRQAFAGMTTDAWIPIFVGIATLLITALLIILFVVDLYTMLLPDVFVLILFGLVAIKLFVGATISLDNVFGVLAGAGFLLFLWAITRGRGIGLGDIKLMVPLGALFGLWGVTTLLFIAFTLGGIVGLFLLAQKKAKLQTQIAFGPFLTGAGLLLIIFPSITNWFSAMLGLTTFF